MNFLLIGQSVEDHIYGIGPEAVKPGGIFYTVAALLKLMEANDNLHLCTAMQKERLNLFSPVYDSIDKRYFDFVNEIPRITLTLYKDKERDETYQNLSLGINLTIDNYSGYDGIFINMITGYDITLETLKRIRKAYSGLIYMDVHSLARKESAEDNTRKHKLIDNFAEWAECLNVIQVNRNELYALSAKDKEEEIAESVLTRDDQYLVVTKEDKGAVLYYKENSVLKSVIKSALRVPVNNTIGCGDVFGAAFFYFFNKGKDAASALEYAVKASGFMVSYSSLEQLENLKKDVLSPIS